MHELQTDVAIVGGGPVGLGLAIELGQRGLDVVVLERHKTPQPVPKGQNLTQRTMEHFHFWGAEEQLRNAVTIPKSYGIGGVTAYGSLLSGIHYDWLQRELVRPYYLTDNERLPQYETERVLRERLRELGNVRFLTGWNAVGLAQHPDHVVLDAVERNGPGTLRMSAKYAIGCDGSRSTVRELAGITQTLSDHDRLMVLLVFHSAELDRLLQRFPGKSYYNVLHPDLKGYWQFFGRVDLEGNFFVHAPVPADAATGNFDFVGFLHRAVGATFDVSITYKGFWDLRFALADNYRSGRIFVAGDAAHSHPPYGGYGVNSGLEDARNLGWKLAAELQGWAGPGLLDSYSAERQAVFQSTIRDFIAKSIDTDRDFLTRFDPQTNNDAFVAEWGARAKGARVEVASYAPHYRGSPITCGHSDANTGAVGSHFFRAEPGCHLAPVAMRSGRCAYDQLGSGFTLFADNASGAAPFLEAAREMALPLEIVIDQAAQLEAHQVLVRPDQFVAWTSNVGGTARDALRQAAGFQTEHVAECT